MIGIIGAGITGLSLQHYLERHEIESTVFEADGGPGGVLHTIHKDGHVLECGPQRMRLTPLIRDLVEAMGLSDNVIEAADVPLYVSKSGTLGRVPFSLRAALTTDLLSWRGKLRILLEPFATIPQEGETVETYLTRAFGPEFATLVGGPLYAGLYASDPKEMPVTHSLRRALDRFGVGRSVLLKLLQTRLKGRSPPPVVSFRNGMQQLPRGLYKHYSDHVSLNAPVRAIRETTQGFELVTEDLTTNVDEVAITTPAPSAASLLEPIDPNSAAALRRLSYNPLAIVHLIADTSLVGAGHQIPFGEPSVTLGVTWNDSLFGRANHPKSEIERSVVAETGREDVYTCFLGGAKRPDAVEWTDNRLGAIAATEFEEITGETAEPIHVHRFTPGMPAYDHSWDGLSSIDLPAEIYLCANYESRAGIPGRVSRAKQLATALATDDREATWNGVPQRHAIRE